MECVSPMESAAPIHGAVGHTAVGAPPLIKDLMDRPRKLYLCGFLHSACLYGVVGHDRTRWEH